ncbi:uncharacterized protein LOC124357064 [Homalodisca vitripennis]|nr:uncharacterized protein LOC124357064 [Homalodisca vitripennis]
MIKLCLLVMCTGAGVLAVTQEQLAQYVAAQQTGHKQQSVSVVPRARQAYALQSAEDAGESAYQQAYQAAYQQAAAAYQPQAAAAYQPQAAPQATSYKSFSSSVGVGKDYQPVYYRPAPGVPQYHDPAQLQPLRKLRPLPGAPDKEPEEDYDPNPAYQFSFDVKDDEFTNYQNRKEQREGDKISGSYSVVDSDGYIRTVTYTADPKEGFKADVSREPTDIRVKLPQPPSALPQQYQQIPQQLVRKQQTQQYLEASAHAGPSPQYAARPQAAVAYVAPQFVAAPQYVGKSSAPATAGLSAYSGPHRLAAPVKAKAAAIGYASQQPTASPILYQAYQQ